MKKLCCLLIALVLCLGSSSLALADASQEVYPPYAWDRDYSFLKNRDDPVTLRMYINASNFDVTGWGKDAYSRWLEQETGVKLEFDSPPADDNQKINLLIATDDLPDLIWFPDHNVASLGTLMNEDYLYTLDELIDQYAPTFKDISLYKNNHEFYRWEQGGELFYLPTNAYDRGLIGNKDTVSLSNTAYYVREDIWKELGEPPMDTWEQVEKVLYEAKEKYPELQPLILWDAYLQYNINSGTNMLYRSQGGGYKYMLHDGVITSQARDPIYLETLWYINKLIKDGIIDKSDFADESSKALEAANQNGEIFMSSGPSWRIINGQTGIQKINPEWNYVCIPHMAKESVGKFFNPHFNLDGLGGALVIPNSTEHPERVIQLYEFLSTDAAQAAVNAGIEGVHWEWAGPGNRWIRAIGKAAEIKYGVGYEEWRKYTGGNLYRWVGSIYYDGAGGKGDSMEDPVRQGMIKVASVWDDFSDFTNIDPLPSMDESVINTKVVDLWKSYMGKVVLEATSIENAQEIWNEFLAKADQLGLPKLEAYWTMKYHELQEVKAKAAQAS